MTTHHQLKPVYLVLECLNALAVALYYCFLFFYTRAQFGFSDLDNLLLSAGNGLLYAVTAWQGGRLSQRIGYLNTLALGVGVMTLALVFGGVCASVPSLTHSPAPQIAVFFCWTLGVSVTWPALEAVVSDHEPPHRLPRMVGIYNVTWAIAWAVAYFSGGAMFEHLGPRSIFFVPLAIYGLEILILIWVVPQAQRASNAGIKTDPETSQSESEPVTPDRARQFRRMAWLANPFAYMAITALVPLIPGLAERHQLTPTWAGIFCSTWFFARLGTFTLLWHWTGWHYRFRWFFLSFALLILSFAGILLTPNLWIVLLFQIIFGFAVGLIYYSSLYYSMDAGDAKGEHGGIHEAAIGAGLFGGPALGSLGLILAPGVPHADTFTVSIALTSGFVAALLMGIRRARPETEAKSASIQ